MWTGSCPLQSTHGKQDSDILSYEPASFLAKVPAVAADVIAFKLRNLAGADKFQYDESVLSGYDDPIDRLLYNTAKDSFGT